MSGSPARTGRPAPARSGRPAPARSGRPAGQPRMGWKAAFLGLAAAAIVAAVAWALLGSRLLIVRSVQVTGTGARVSRAQVLAAAQIRLGLPLIRVDTSAAAHRVGRLHDVQSAQVSRGWPDAIVISVRQRTPVFTVAVPGGYELVDAFGVDMGVLAHRPAGYPLLTVGSAASVPWPGEPAVGPAVAGGHGATHKPASPPAHQAAQTPPPAGAATPAADAAPAGDSAAAPLRGNPAIRAAAAVLHELPPAIARRVQAVHAPIPSDISVRLAGGIVIVWGDTSRATEKSKELALLMRTAARGYDVSAPGTAVTEG
jgi:cell division protein FtsQ